MLPQRWSSRPRFLPFLFFSLFAVLLAPTTTFAQEGVTTGVIRGVVRDPTGAPVAGAAVMVRNQQTGLERAVETNAQGIFVIQLLSVGTYDVTARAIGQFGDVEEGGVVVRLGEAVALVLEFRPVELEELLVTGEAPLVDPTDVTSSVRLSREVVEGLPNNGRNFLDYTLLTPGVGIVQGPDGDVLAINGQRGIFNNVIVDGADFNNPFFGEQRGGQRPAFTFNQEAIQEMVVVNQGATAEFGRSAGGFVNVLTKSGTNEFEGSAHYFGQWDGISTNFPDNRQPVDKPDFFRSQFGFTFGGPIVRDKAHFFVAYDQQEMTETKQFTRSTIQNPAEFAKLEDFLQTNFDGVLANDFGPIERTDDAKALIAKIDWNISDSHKASVKYNYTKSEQINGTFDVDAWARSSNGVEKDESHAINGALTSQLGSAWTNEFRFQWAREDRIRPYAGPLIPGGTPPSDLPQFAGGQPFPDTGMDFVDGFRFGMPFFLPIDPAYDDRIQILDNVSFLKGAHLFKVGGEWNRTSVTQQFVGFAASRYIFTSVDGFINYVEQGPLYVECSDGSNNATGACPAGTSITGPLDTYLQSATVPPVPGNQLGLQSFAQNELAFFIQDTWTPNPNLTINLGVRWEGLWNPDMIVAPEDVFYAPFIGQTKNGIEFPSDGTIHNDLNNFAPRLGIAWDVKGNGRSVVRGNVGAYYARIPALILAQHRTANGSFQQNLFRASFLNEFGITPPAYGELIDTSGAGPPDHPSIQVPSTDLALPRTWSFGAEYEQMIGEQFAVRINYQHARTDNLFRFVNLNDPVFGSPWTTGLPAEAGNPTSPADTLNGIFDDPFTGLVTTTSSGRSNYNGVTLGLKGRGERFNFEANYTLSFDKSDDDNERDPFVYKYARADALEAEYNWSDRDQRHRFNGYFLFLLPADIVFNNIIRYSTAQPVSEACGAGNVGTGGRAAFQSQRICADGSVLPRNTLRKDNELFTWDIRISKEFSFGPNLSLEPILDIFNLTNTDNFLDTAPSSLLFNFDGTIRSGLGNTRRAQLGVKFRF